MVSSTPNMPSAISASSTTNVKEATPDIIIQDASLLATEAMFDLAFEEISAQEIITIARHDTISGKAISYQPITNLAKLSIKYGPQSIIPIQNSSKSYFDNFAIKLENHIPNEGEGLGGTYVYMNADNSLVIDLVNVAGNEQVEVQILKTGEINNGTIY